MGRPVAPGEPQWTEEDTLLAIEWQRFKDALCGGCGHPLDESLDEGNDYDVQKITCFACQAKEHAEKAAAEAENADSAGRKLTTVLVGRRPVIDDN